MRIPFVSCLPDQHGVRATFGLSLSAIYPVSAPLAAHETPASDAGWQEQHERTAKLLALLSRWPSPCSLELHILSRPSLDGRVSARNDVVLFVHVRSSDKNSALEHALKRYV